MAATYRTSAAGGGTSSTGNRTCAITTLAGDLVLVFCSASGNTNAAPTCSDDQGGAYTLIDSAAFGASANTGSWFVGNALVGTGAATTITVATGSNTAAEIVAVAIAGMSRSGASAIRSQGKQANQASATTPAPALNQAALTGNPTIGAVFNSTNPATMTAPASWTERQDVGQSTPTTGLEVVTRDSGFTGTTVTWGSTSGSAFASAIVEIDSSSPPATGTSSTTQGANTSSASATVAVTATSATTQGADTGAASASIAIQATCSVTQGADTGTGTGTVSTAGVTGTASVTQAADTSASVATVAITGTGATTQGAGTAGATGAVAVGVTGSATQGANTASGAGSVAVNAAATAGQSAQTSTASVTVAIGATGTASQGAQTSTAAASVAVAGTASATQDAQTGAGTATTAIAVTATVDVTQGADTSTGRAVVEYPQSTPRLGTFAPQRMKRFAGPVRLRNRR